MRQVVVITICSLFLVSGCTSSWDGFLSPTDKIRPWEGAPQTGRVWFENPVVIDNDKQRDFTPIAQTYAASLQTQMANNACSSSAFRSCLTFPPKDGKAYKVSTTVEIANYRPDNLALVAVGGVLLPPLVGLLWSIPAGTGHIDVTVSWRLQDTMGNTIAEAKGKTNCLALYLAVNIGKMLPNFTEFLKTASAAIARQEQKTAKVSQPVENISARQAATVPALKQKTGLDQTSLHSKTPTTSSTVVPGPIVAVFNVEDQSGQIEHNTLNQLTNYLAAKLTQISGYRVVPRDQIRQKLVEQQNESYKECYDQSCQIELGKAIAAEKSLATQIIRIGNKCAVTSSLFDLRTEATEQAASVDTECSDDYLMDAVKQIAEQLRIK